MQQLVKMTSKELVEIINAVCKETGNGIEIQHNDLVKRIKGFTSILPTLSTQMAEYLDARGKPKPMLLLSKEACLLAVCSESPQVILATLHRWQELEMQARPLTSIEALEQLLASAKEKERLRVLRLLNTLCETEL